jgi:LCP family protein required for cell wall assembly
VILCLLPVRNGGEDLARWLARAHLWCDGVVALDDGSTDDTLDRLEASPLVLEVLTHPVRPTAAGWDDGRNRAELLAAAHRHAPDWILWVDVDEVLAADDAAALRAFLERDALPGVAYGLRHHRMWGEADHDPVTSWVYRLHSWRPDHELPDERLHFNPVPLQVPRRAWVRTSIRLQHFGAADETRISARARKYELADPEAEYPTDFGDMDRAPIHTVPWRDRDPDQPLVLGPEQAVDPDRTGTDPAGFAAARPSAAGDRPLVVALLPVRNGAHDLAGWFDSVLAVADAVVALDDGSTDDTASILAAEPSVQRLLSHPVRPDHTGWDDAGNRQELLDAAAELRPRWVLFVDADERFSPDDAAALRAFIEDEAVEGAAYGFRVHRMIGDQGHFDRDDLWVYRLFARQPDLEMPEARLHFVPVPRQIAPDRWVRTSIRLQHLGGSTPERRSRRFRKYHEADPDREFQADYGNLLEPPGELSLWAPRDPDEPILVGDGAGDAASTWPTLDHRDPDAVFDPDAPVLSAVVIARDDRERIVATLESVVSQELDVPFEVIAVVSGSDGTAEVVREQFPSVHLIDLGPAQAYPGRARNAGVAVARGDYVSFPGSHVVLPPGSLAARVRAHSLGYPMVTGSMRNANFSDPGWASYFLDHASVLPGSPSGEMSFAPPHCSYDRELLVAERGFPEDMRAGEDTVVNTALFRRGLRAWRATEVELFHASPCTDLPGLVGHHFRRGRGLGRIMIDGVPPGGRLVTRPVLRRTAVGYVPRRWRSTVRNVRRHGDGELNQHFDRVRPLVAAGVVAAWAGTWFELLRPSPAKLQLLLGTPARNVLLVGLDRRPGDPVGRADATVLARLDLLRGRLVLWTPPHDLLVEVPGVGPALLNEAYTLGATAEGGNDQRAGLRLVAQTVSGLLGLRIDVAATVDFDGFVELVDALGGVQVDPAHPIDDEFAADDGEALVAHFAPGLRRVDGATALSYARTRRADGERWRRERHLELIRSIAAEASRSWRDTIAAARAARRTVHIEGTRRDMLLAALAARRAQRNGAVRSLTLAPPAVRPVRLGEHGWVHVGDRDLIEQELRERVLSGGGAGPAGGAAAGPSGVGARRR